MLYNMLLFYYTDNTMWKKIWRIIEKPFVIVSSICSIISVIAICFNNIIATIIAISTLCISLTIILIAILRVLNRFLEKSTTGDHKCISSFIKYKTDDGENIEFESYKLIQVKCCIMQFFDIGFRWSGNNFPKVSSDLQDVELLKKSDNTGEYDSAKLRLKKPALYNETTVIHFKTQSNDAEKVSESKVELYVKYPIEFIQVNISLGYKDGSFNKTAKIERLKMGTIIPQKYELMTSIPFDSKSKQYSHCFIDPEPGFFYKISWER